MVLELQQLTAREGSWTNIRALEASADVDFPESETRSLLLVRIALFASLTKRSLIICAANKLIPGRTGPTVLEGFVVQYI